MFEFNENNEVTDKHVYRAILVGVSFGEDITASMEELNATMNLLAEASKNLTDLSRQLEEEIAFFQIDD